MTETAERYLVGQGGEFIAGVDPETGFVRWTRDPAIAEKYERHEIEPLFPATGVRTTRCRECGDELITAECYFCGHTNE